MFGDHQANRRNDYFDAPHQPVITRIELCMSSLFLYTTNSIKIVLARDDGLQLIFNSKHGIISLKQIEDM